MTITPSTLLSLPLITSGTESGLWGNIVNNGSTSYLDIAIAGTLTLTGDGAVTLANTQGSDSATNISSTTAQYYILKIVGPLTTTKVITAPSVSKTYIVNNTDSTYGVTVKASGQTGVTVAAGQRALVVYNGTDYVQVGASAGGSNTQVQYNSSGALAGSSNLTFDGTKLTAAGIKDSALTSGRVTYATTSGELTDSTNLTFDGTTLTANSIKDSALTSGRVTTAGASGVLQDSANLTWDGSNLQVGSQGDLRLGDSDNSNWVAFQAPATVTSNVTWTLPSTDGTSGQVLSTNGSGTLSWAAASSVSPFSFNTTTVSQNYTFASGQNAVSVGPITISSGFSVTVPSGQRWVVL